MIYLLLSGDDKRMSWKVYHKTLVVFFSVQNKQKTQHNKKNNNFPIFLGHRPGDISFVKVALEVNKISKTMCVEKGLQDLGANHLGSCKIWQIEILSLGNIDFVL